MNYIKKYNILIVLVLISIITITSSCKKSFLDVNDNPNTVTELNVAPELIFPAAAVRTAGRTAARNFDFLSHWMGYTAQSGVYARDDQETSYNIDFGFGESLWQNHYDVLFDLYQTKTKALVKGDSVLAGASIILSAKMWQELVDLYGNIPFKDVFQVTKTTTPGYDKDSTVYRLLLAQLNDAVGYMKTTAKLSYPTVIGSIVKFGTTPLQGTFAQQQANWIRYANTMKLRLLIRISQVSVPGINTANEILKINADGGVLQAGQTISINPGFVNENAKQSPFYGNYGLTPTGADANQIERANKYTVDTMVASSDDRLQRLYRPTSGTTVTPCVYGALGNPTGASKNGEGTAGTATQDQWIITSTESLFLQAEAIARGWALNSPYATPTLAYNAAVTESFIWLGVPSASTAATTYLASNSLPAAPFANQFKQILYQKYLAMNSIDPVESYSDLRRSNFTMIPTTVLSYISKNSNRIANKLPNRLLYPQEEYTLNGANVNAQGTINTSTIFTGSKIFWQLP